MPEAPNDPMSRLRTLLLLAVAFLALGGVTVVSALDGMTEELLALADAAGTSNRPAMDARLREIRRRHEELAKATGDASLVAAPLDQLDHLALGISAVGELTARSKDAVTAYGEVSQAQRSLARRPAAK